MSGPETWLPVAGYEGRYEVSDQGRVRSLHKRNPGHIKKQRNHKEYWTVALKYDGVHHSPSPVHVLVATAFLGPRPHGMDTCHNNGDSLDNRLENLRYDTHSANQLDSVRHGTHAEARRTHCTKGHPYDKANTYVAPSGSRSCRACGRQSAARYRERKEAA